MQNVNLFLTIENFQSSLLYVGVMDGNYLYVERCSFADEYPIFLQIPLDAVVNVSEEVEHNTSFKNNFTADINDNRVKEVNTFSKSILNQINNAINNHNNEKN